MILVNMLIVLLQRIHRDQGNNFYRKVEHLIYILQITAHKIINLLHFIFSILIFNTINCDNYKGR